MNPQERIEWIEKYLLGELTEAEKQTFEAQLKTDTQLAEDLALQKSLIDAHTEKEVIEFRHLVNDVQSDQINKSGNHKIKVVSFRRILTIAASVALVIAAALVLYLQNSGGINNEEVFAEFFNEESLSLSFNKVNLTSRDTTSEEISTIEESYANWMLAIDYYEKEKYNKALEAMLEVDKSALEQDSSRYYYQLGLIYLSTNNPKEALHYLNKKGTYNESQRTWYRCLAMLYNNEPREELEEALVPIVNSKSHPFRKEAKKLAKKLKINFKD